MTIDIAPDIQKQVQAQEPPKRTIQVGISADRVPCVTAIGYASEALGSSASHNPVDAANIAIDQFGKSDWLDISVELPKDIAASLKAKAEVAGLAGLFLCSCGNSFSIRLSDPE